MGVAIADDWADQESQTDRRYLELHAAVVDSTKLAQIPPAEPIIDQVLYANSVNWLHGKPGHGKTFVAMDWACHVATGTHWRDFETHGWKVLYIVAEGAHGMHDRRQAWELASGVEVPAGRLFFLPVAVQLMKDLDVDALEQLARELDVGMIVVDTQARVTVGADENSAKDMGVFIDHLEQLRTVTQACVLVVHHESRSGDSLRGSTALEGAATTVVRATKDGTLIRLDNTKQKDGPPFDPIIGRLASIALPSGRMGAAWSHSTLGLGAIATESETKILTTLRDLYETTGASNTELREATGLPKSTFQRSLTTLVRRGVLVNVGTQTRTRYVIPGTETLA